MLYFPKFGSYALYYLDTGGEDYTATVSGGDDYKQKETGLDFDDIPNPVFYALSGDWTPIWRLSWSGGDEIDSPCLSRLCSGYLLDSVGYIQVPMGSLKNLNPVP